MNSPIIILILVTVLCILFQKSKLVTCLTFVFIWTLSWTSNQPDYANYQIMFLDETSSDIGYAWISRISKNIGLDYYSFRLLFLAVGWIIYAWFIIRFSKRCALVSAIYLWTMSLFDMVQNRNFVAFSICLIGISMLFENQSLRKQIHFFVSILIASSIHITCAFFLIFLVLNKNTLSKLSKFQICLFSVICAAILIIFFSKEISTKVDNYDTGVSTLTKGLLLLLFIFNIAYINYVKHLIPNKFAIQNLSSWQKSYSVDNKNTMWMYNIALCLLLPASFMSLSALRIFRYSGIMNICYSINRVNTKLLSLNLILTIILIIYSCSYLLVSYLMHKTSFLLILYPPFYSNDFYALFE